ncbi:MAG TPA: NAD-dependent epimerase/dehydratase family protein [Paludibacter sp.]|jgi:dihydroflavonol-4-reductase|nr:NAD-dependent epimerase/dehydratase family protein [Paludibacter sp.]HOS46270.1 NAD-dependent epimerase/dehydratase family protein [Paludibacter sp.]HPM08851.1 NAD-dependent epimerase/dehydratase family protein [Paludibacter sp.]
MILVTGATGLVGGHLLWHLLQQHEEIVAIKRSSSNMNTIHTVFKFYTKNPDEHLKKIAWRIADVNDYNSLQKAMSGIEQIYHCAAIVSLGKQDNNIDDVNVSGTRNMVELALAHKVKKFCYVSSIAACGFSHKGEMIDEETPFQSSTHKTPYAVSKHAAEQEIWKGIEKGLKAIIVNPGVILGVSGAKSSSMLLFHQVKRGFMFYTLGGSGYVDVQDVVKAMILLMDSDIHSERFILVGENNSNQEILNWMATGFNKPKPFIKVGRRLITVIGFLSEISGKIFKYTPLLDRSMGVSATNRSYYSSQKIKDAIGYQFNPISNCIADVCRFMLQN